MVNVERIVVNVERIVVDVERIVVNVASLMVTNLQHSWRVIFNCPVTGYS
jgi:hypothetical protein